MVENENVQSVADKNLSGGQPTSDAGASGGPEGGEAAPEAPVLYVYECVSCGHRGEERLPGDSHDGRPSACLACGASVVLEWDGGVTLHADVPRR
ncbi:MAG: hypothetical protein QMC36_00160 [Patescibacteria group bacterium]